jgi:hypothetical protein
MMIDIIKNAIEKNKTIKINAYSVSAGIEEKIKIVLRFVLERHGCDVLYYPIYTVVKELLINAIKAIFKNIYFENYLPKKINVQALDYKVALKLFKLELGREESNYLSFLARGMGIKAAITLKMNNDTLNINVSSPTPMTEIENENVKRKLELAKTCRSISEYFFQEDEDPNQEGSGLGLILIMMILKSLGLDESGFVIKSTGSGTVADLHVPLNQETIKKYNISTETDPAKEAG